MSEFDGEFSGDTHNPAIDDKEDDNEEKVPKFDVRLIDYFEQNNY